MAERQLHSNQHVPLSRVFREENGIAKVFDAEIEAQVLDCEVEPSFLWRRGRERKPVNKNVSP